MKNEDIKYVIIHEDHEGYATAYGPFDYFPEAQKWSVNQTLDRFPNPLRIVQLIRESSEGERL